MTRLTRRAICVALLAMIAMPQAARAEDTAAAAEQKPVAAAGKAADAKPLVQIAILLDNSGSMSGLINQARTELWKVVNEFVAAEINGVRPDLQVALYHYGNPPATQLVPLTDDLDRVSEALFGIQISGGSEYCGQVIDMATRELAWSDARRDLKLIFIAGNEPFSQGPVDYRQACKAAIAKGIMVNTIHCGNGIPQDWAEGALLADGKSISIDHNSAVVNIEAPQDKEIAKLGVELNKTYIAYGKQGQAGARRQMAQDANASGASTAVAQQRAVAKANAFYRNSAWDLCDALKEGKVDLAKIKPEELPENMRKMTPDERVAYVKKMQDERAAIQTKINQLNQQRTAFVAEKQQELAEEGGEATLDKALIGAIREQATKKQFNFGS